MKTVKGKYNEAIVYTDVAEDMALQQIKQLCDMEFAADARIRIMPDVHAGAGCTIGTTMTIHDRVVPNLVGVDIGCWYGYSPYPGAPARPKEAGHADS